MRAEREQELKGEKKKMIHNGSFTDLKIPQVYFVRKKKEEAMVGRFDRSVTYSRRINDERHSESK